MDVAATIGHKSQVCEDVKLLIKKLIGIFNLKKWETHPMINILIEILIHLNTHNYNKYVERNNYV